MVGGWPARRAGRGGRAGAGGGAAVGLLVRSRAEAAPPTRLGPARRPPGSGGARAGPATRPGLRGRTDARTGVPPGVPGGAMCVQRFDGSLNSAIHITYRISLRSSSMPEPRDPLLKVFSSSLAALSRSPSGALTTLSREAGLAGSAGGGRAGRPGGGPGPGAPARRGNWGRRSRGGGLSGGARRGAPLVR